jgi:hypothetical protein
MQDLLNWVTVFFGQGIYDFASNIFSSAIEWWMLFKIQSTLWAVKFSWGIAQSVISSLGISTLLTQAWGNLDSDVASAAMFFRVPEGLNLILTSLTTKFVMKFVPGGI